MQSPFGGTYLEFRYNGEFSYENSTCRWEATIYKNGQSKGSLGNTFPINPAFTERDVLILVCRDVDRLAEERFGP